MKATKRIRRDPEDARALILATAARIMLEEGYAAVSMRRVAKAAGLSATLVHYYYPTADDLLVALYRHSSEQDLQRLRDALAASDPIAALWQYQTDSARTVLGIEFLALASHRKAIKAEIARFATFARAMQADVLAAAVSDSALSETGCPPLCLATLITSVARNLILEDGVGISLGHEETRAFVRSALGRLRVSQPGKRETGPIKRGDGKASAAE